MSTSSSFTKAPNFMSNHQHSSRVSGRKKSLSGISVSYAYCQPSHPFCTHTSACNSIPTTNKVPIIQSPGLEGVLVGAARGRKGEPQLQLFWYSELGLLYPGLVGAGRKPCAVPCLPEFHMQAAQVSSEQMPFIRFWFLDSRRWPWPVHLPPPPLSHMAWTRGTRPALPPGPGTRGITVQYRASYL